MDLWIISTFLNRVLATRNNIKILQKCLKKNHHIVLVPLIYYRFFMSSLFAIIAFFFTNGLFCLHCVVIDLGSVLSIIKLFNVWGGTLYMYMIKFLWYFVIYCRDLVVAFIYNTNRINTELIQAFLITWSHIRIG